MSNRSQFDSRRGGPPPVRDQRQGSRAAASPELVALFGQAVALHQAGRLMEAEPLYRKVLQAQPRHFDALHLIGVVHYQRGEYDEAVRRIDQALKINPNVAAAHNNRGSVLKDLGRLKEALASYDRAIALKSDYVDAFYNRGNVLRLLARSEEAVASYDRAIALRPAYPDAWNNRGSALKELRRFDDALASFDQALSLKPDYAEAWYNRANALSELKLFDEALESCDRAIALRSNFVEAFNNRGNALKKLRRFEEAVQSYDRALALRADYADAFINRGSALTAQRRLGEALADYDRGLAFKPDHVDAFFSRGIALAELGRIQEALESHARAVALDPGHADALYKRGALLLSLRRLDEAVKSFERALAIRPDLDDLKGMHLHARMHLCDWTDFNASCADLNASIASGTVIYPFHLLATSATAALQSTCARTYVAAMGPASFESLWRGERYGHDRIRLAYVSADFRDHPVGRLIAGLFAHHDRSRFETVAISFGPDQPGPMREALKASCDRFVDAHTISNRDIARLMRELEIDIAVDLNGFTNGARQDVFAHRPAPVQVNYLGYAGTLGQDCYDYVIADRFVIPEEARTHYAEKVVYLPDTFMITDSNRKISERAPSRAQAGLPETGFVFCCFNSAYKITPDLFDIWMRLLREIAGSVLWLSNAAGTAPNNLRSEAESRGVAGERLVFAPNVASSEDYLARLGLADLFLDTLYYNAHATAVDALWAGVPVLTCAGGTFASRVAGSLLGALGLPELITTSLEDYEALALRLAREPVHLAAVRAKLARHRTSRPLFDTARFTRHIEAAFTTMRERAERGEPPESFGVSPIGQAQS